MAGEEILPLAQVSLRKIDDGNLVRCSFGSNHPIIFDHFLLLEKGRVSAMALAKRSCSHLIGDLLHLSLRIVFLADWRISNSCPQEREIAN